MPLHIALAEVVGRNSILVVETWSAVGPVEDIGSGHDDILGLGRDEFTLEIILIEDWLDINMLKLAAEAGPVTHMTMLVVRAVVGR